MTRSMARRVSSSLLVSAIDEDRCCFFCGSKEGSRMVLSVEARDRRDLDGRVDWEKGVVGEIRAEALPAAVALENAVAREGREISLSFLPTTVWYSFLVAI